MGALNFGLRGLDMDIGPLGGIQIIETIYAGDLTIPPMPEHLVRYKGPYRKRKQKKWRKLNPAYHAPSGKYYQMGNVIMCHPVDAAKLRSTLRNVC